MYPVSLSLEGRPCLVVGGGSVALRKISGLLDEQAAVMVVSPEVVPAVDALWREGRIALHRRTYRQGEASAYALVLAATDDREVNRQVFADARAANIWVNVADDPDLCTFHLPARVQRGALQIAIGSGGRAPFVSRRLRQFLELRMGDEWAEWIDAAGRFRDTVRASSMTDDEQERLYGHFFESTMDRERFAVRVPEERESRLWCRAGVGALPASAPSPEGPRKSTSPEPGLRGARLARRAPVSIGSNGFVSLVGAGPGDPGLLSIKGRERLMKADAVVCDRLAVPALPCDLPPRVALHFVGKEAGNHPVPQEEINALLVRLAKEGKRVVRLKGGDPYVFGRGGEEAGELVRAGVPFEVIPGVTAAVAVPAYAGIPVTHRKEVVRVTFVTAHESIKDGGPQVRWDLLARDPHAMILGYMGVTRLPKVVGYLLEAGMEPDTPAAVIERGTTAMQRTVLSTLAGVAEAVLMQGLGPPAIFAIGPTVRHAKSLDWFGSRPLLGQRLAAFCPDAALVDQLQLNGAEVVGLTAPVTSAARMVMDALPVTGALFAAAEEVSLMADERHRESWVKVPTAWCLTPGAARAARRLGWSDVAFVSVEGATGFGPLIAAMVDRADAGGPS